MKNIMQPGLKGLSSHNLTAEELALLNIIKSMAGVDGSAKVFDVNADGTVVPAEENPGPGFDANILLSRGRFDIVFSACLGFQFRRRRPAKPPLPSFPFFMLAVLV
jgi:hypothetical protein